MPTRRLYRLAMATSIAYWRIDMAGTIIVLIFLTIYTFLIINIIVRYIDKSRKDVEHKIYGLNENIAERISHDRAVIISFFHSLRKSIGQCENNMATLIISNFIQHNEALSVIKERLDRIEGMLNEGFEKLAWLHATGALETGDEQIIKTAMKGISIGETVYFAEYQGDDIVCHSFECGGFVIEKDLVQVLSEGCSIDREIAIEQCFLTSQDAIAYCREQGKVK